MKLGLIMMKWDYYCRSDFNSEIKLLISIWGLIMMKLGFKAVFDFLGLFLMKLGVNWWCEAMCYV